MISIIDRLPIDYLSITYQLHRLYIGYINNINLAHHQFYQFVFHFPWPYFVPSGDESDIDLN